MAMLVNFEHAGLTVSNIDRSLAFYVNLIGMRLLRRRRSPNGGAEVAFVEAAGARLELIRPDGPIVVPARRAPDTEAGIRHITFNFDDVDAIFERLVAAGVTPLERPRDAHNRDLLARVAFVLDPDGIVVELVQRA
jgi:glyoxylase I family protein